MDPQSRILLEQTSLALSAAGSQPASNTGVYVGVMHMEYIQHITGGSSSATWIELSLYGVPMSLARSIRLKQCLVPCRARREGHAQRVYRQRHGLPRGPRLIYLWPPGKRFRRRACRLNLESAMRAVQGNHACPYLTPLSLHAPHLADRSSMQTQSRRQSLSSIAGSMHQHAHGMLIVAGGRAPGSQRA